MGSHQIAASNGVAGVAGVKGIDYCRGFDSEGAALWRLGRDELFGIVQENSFFTPPAEMLKQLRARKVPEAA